MKTAAISCHPLSSPARVESQLKSIHPQSNQTPPCGQQVVAWEDKDATPSGPNGAVGRVMRYGIVIIGGSAEAGEGGVVDQDVPEVVGGGRFGRTEEGLGYMRVKLTPCRVDTLMSTKVGYDRL